MAPPYALMVGEVDLSTFFTHTRALLFTSFVAKLTSTSFTAGTIFLKILLDGECLFAAVDTVAKAFYNQLLMLYTYYLETSLAPIFFGLIFNAIVFNCTLRVALGTNNMIRRIVWIAHRFKIFENSRGWNKRYINFWAHHTL